MRALVSQHQRARAGALAPCSSAPAARALAAPLLNLRHSGRRLCVAVAAKGGKPKPDGTGGSGNPGPSPAEVLASAARQLQAAADKQAAGQPSFAASSQAAAELQSIAAAVKEIRGSVLRQEAAAKQHALILQLQNALLLLHTVEPPSHAFDKSTAQGILTDALSGSWRSWALDEERAEEMEEFLEYVTGLEVTHGTEEGEDDYGMQVTWHSFEL